MVAIIVIFSVIMSDFVATRQLLCKLTQAAYCKHIRQKSTKDLCRIYVSSCEHSYGMNEAFQVRLAV